MINTQLDDGFENVLRMIRFVGETMLRPAGLAADRRGTPIPVDDPMFIQWNQTGLSFGAVGTGKNSKTDGECGEISAFVLTDASATNRSRPKLTRK